MMKWFKTLSVVLFFILMLSACSKQTSDLSKNKNLEGQLANVSPIAPTATPTTPQIDYEKVKPNENGKIIIVMFHNFVESFTPTKYDNGEYTTTFESFRNLLPSLYEKGFRLISLTDYLNNNIKVPAGYIPMIFTFDDGTKGQFNLIEKNGKLVVDSQSAVGILEEFNKTHPDFGINATFFVNLGLETFEGKGTLAQRLKYLTDKGFEIGNHTYTHINLSQTQSSDKIQEEMGKNQIKMNELIPGYKLNALALPYGSPSKSLQQYVEKGIYNNVTYQNKAIMEVGWDPALSPVSKRFNHLSIHRVRSSGISPVDADLAWWLKNISRNELYVSDGDENIVSIPKEKASDIDDSKLNGKKLVTY